MRGSAAQPGLVRALISSTFISILSNSDRRYCSCARSVGSVRNATFTRKRFKSDAITRLSECCERRAMSSRRISMKSRVSRSEYNGVTASPLGTRTKGNVRS